LTKKNAEPTLVTAEVYMMPFGFASVRRKEKRKKEQMLGNERRWKLLQMAIGEAIQRDNVLMFVCWFLMYLLLYQLKLSDKEN
jgi:hypothetical protein